MRSLTHSRTRTRRSSQKNKSSLWHLTYKLVAACCLLMVMVGVSLWLIWQQITLPDDLSALVLVDENRQPHQVIVSRFSPSNRDIMVVSKPIQAQASTQETDFNSQIMLQLGLPLEEIQTFTSPSLGDENVMTALAQHPPQNLSSWQKLKWQWLLQHKQVTVQALDQDDDITTTVLVKQLRSNANFTCAVAIINTTKQPGLASQVASVIENGGKRVVQITNGPSEYTTTQVFFSEAECEEAAQDVSLLTPSKQQPQRNASVTLQYRADVVIFLGTDFKTN